MSKIDSLQNILDTVSPEVVVISETKQSNACFVQNFFDKNNYSALLQKESGILIAAKKKYKLVETTCTSHHNILTGRLVAHDTPIRIIAVYGLQETCHVDAREEFYEELCTEIESCTLHDDNPIIAGDFNSKVELNDNTLIHLTPNGKLLCNVIETYSLDVMNYHPTCTGKWTRVRLKNGTIERSVLDYILTNKLMSGRVTQVSIDEERLITPFTVSKTKGLISRVSTDHNTLLTEFSWVPEKNLLQKKPEHLTHPGWKLTPEGITEFYKETSTVPNTIPQNYEEFEDMLTATMNKCFKMKRPPKSIKNPNHCIHHKPLLKIFQALKSFLKAGRNEKAAAMEYVSLLQRIQLDSAHKARSVRVKETLDNLHEENSKNLSVRKFWQLKKCITTERDSKTSVLTENGVELFDDPAILHEYVKEFKTRLAHKSIHPDLAAFQEVSHKLLQLYLEKAKSVSQTPFTTHEVDAVLVQSKKGKAPGGDQFLADVLPYAGATFVEALTNALNYIKAKLTIPDSWIDVIITTLFKNKGSRKYLKNHRGIFLTSIFSKVMEKLIKSRIQENLQHITPFQCGATLNHSTADCMFMVNSLIDHAKYLKSPLYLTLYDYSTCFDSLWLEDTMLSLWDLGVQDDIFPLIYKMNELCNIKIRTPHGTSQPFTCERIVKQGAVLSTSLCGSSTSQLTKELEHLPECGANILDAQIKAVLFVDDTITANTDIIGAIRSHEHFIRFSRRKRLGLNGPKCALIIINPRKDIPPPVLLVDGVEIQVVSFAKYLGDIISANGGNGNLIQDRVKKGKAIIISALSLCNDMTLGYHYIGSALLLYKAIFLASVLFNSQAWTNITKTQMTQLRTVQLKYLKRTLQVPNSTPNAFTFLELGVLPIEFEIHRRQLMFLHHIHTLPTDDPVQMIFSQQKLLPFEKNWWNGVVQLLEKYELTDAEYCNMPKEEWKSMVDTNISEYAFKQLKNECSNMTKTFHLKYENFQRQQYITSCPSDIARLIFKIRGRVLNCRDNHHRSNEITTCRMCNVQIESQNHTINCKQLFPSDATISLQTYMSSSFEVDLEQLQEIERRYKHFQAQCKN